MTCLISTLWEEVERRAKTRSQMSDFKACDHTTRLEGQKVQGEEAAWAKAGSLGGAWAWVENKPQCTEWSVGGQQVKGQ